MPHPPWQNCQMNHPELNRRAYLQAMGIDVWVSRDTPDPMAAALPSESDSSDLVATDSLDWDELRRTVSDCTRCGLANSRTQTVFGVGNQNATWMIIGEAPGAEEDRRGEPFVGRAGQMLTEMLRAIGQSREAVFIANILKCRPPNNRDPEASEAAACRDYLQRQIALVQPSIILAVGKIAAQNLLQSDEPVGRLRGREHALDGVPVVVTYHPAYLLRSPSQKRKVWSDLCMAKHLAEKVAA